MGSSALCSESQEQVIDDAAECRRIVNVKQLSAHQFQMVRRRSVFTSLENSPTLLFLPFVDFGFQASLTSVEQSRALKQTALSFGELSIGRFSFRIVFCGGWRRPIPTFLFHDRIEMDDSRARTA